MQTNSKQLISDLLQIVEQTTAKVQQFKTLDATTLNFKENPEKWSILECIEHLNLYGDYYLPEIEKRMLAQKPNTAATMFKSGFVGNYFANLMRDEAKPGKMKSPKDKNPTNSALTTTTIDRFLKQQERLKTLLTQAQQIDLTKTKTAISISNLIKLRLGDTFRFLVYHIERHVKQAERVVHG